MIFIGLYCLFIVFILLCHYIKFNNCANGPNFAIQGALARASGVCVSGTLPAKRCLYAGQVTPAVHTPRRRGPIVLSIHGTPVHVFFMSMSVAESV